MLVFRGFVRLVLVAVSLLLVGVANVVIVAEDNCCDVTTGVVFPFIVDDAADELLTFVTDLLNI